MTPANRAAVGPCNGALGGLIILMMICPPFLPSDVNPSVWWQHRYLASSSPLQYLGEHCAHGATARFRGYYVSRADGDRVIVDLHWSGGGGEVRYFS